MEIVRDVALLTEEGLFFFLVGKPESFFVSFFLYWFLLSFSRTQE